MMQLTLRNGVTQQTIYNVTAAGAAAVGCCMASECFTEGQHRTPPATILSTSRAVRFAEHLLTGTSTLSRTEKGHLSGLPMLPTTALSASTQTATHTAPSPQPFCLQAASTALSVAAKDCWTAFLAAFEVTT